MPEEVYMRDEEYLFKEDVLEKAITARSAKKRPRHSGCRLPQYTAKEMREMSGPTYTLNLKKRITYAEFKALPEGLQKSYVQNIIDEMLEDYEISERMLLDEIEYAFDDIGF